MNSEGIIESLPIGTLVFRIVETENGSETEIITINDRLLQFANMVHSYVDSKDDGLWDKQKLFWAFKKNIYAFAIDEDVPIVQELVAEAREHEFSQKIFRLRGTYGENMKWISAMCSSKKESENSRIYFTLFLDNTKQVLYERKLLDKQTELEQISRYDSLTNVSNRYSYNQFLEQNRIGMLHQTGIIFMDINGLKAANDEFGHLFGDSIIMGFADILMKHFDHKDIFRISGDEFVVILSDIDVVDFENRAHELLREIREHDTAAVGYKWETTIVDLKQAIYQTEQLMMIQKQQYYANSRSQKESKHRPKILESLLNDMDKGRFLIYLQPKAMMGSMKVIGAEALIRKYGADGSIIPPFEFVPILEKELLISRIDFFVLEEVCKMLARWKLTGRRMIKISVNMSRVSIAENGFLEHILEVCQRYAVDHRYLEFEITESTETRDDRKLIEIVSTLSELGFGVALDDMGSDYSSLKMVTMQGVDVVKIDRALVLQMQQPEGAALIRYIIALCHELGKRCIAEGVEEVGQATALAGMGCDYYQGYLLNRPIAVEKFEAYLEE